VNRFVILFISLIIGITANGQQKTVIYCFPGQGSDKHLFDSISLDSNYVLDIIEYGSPEKGMGMESFARSLSVNIDTTRKFILLGVSLGGMICIELSEFLNPEKTIIISSAKNRKELPLRYKFQRTVPLYKIFGGRTLLAGAKFLQPIVEPDRNKNKETFKQMISSKDPTYMKRTISLIINWRRISNSKRIYQIHGNNDHTIPLRNITNPDFIIRNGSHMITLTRPAEINKNLNSILLEK
jgi:pimeloyl-ACP methyl ester carboxylesterase